MGKWRSVERIAAVALTGLIAALVPNQAAFSDERGKPELVTLGMSQAEVEALVGPGSSTCWNYDRGAFSNERICFRDGMVHTHGMQRHEGNEIHFQTAIAPDWPPPGTGHFLDGGAVWDEPASSQPTAGQAQFR